MLRTQAQQETIEDQALAPYAARSRGAVREYGEPEPEYRTHFQRDWNRVLHSRGFKRLGFKTQVMPFGLGNDYIRNRMTHSLEASQVAMGIARILGLNEDLAMAITLAHDLGHPPFGHNGERALHRLCSEFNHNVHSLRIVTEMEYRYPDYPGLNLTTHTLEGIEKHNTDYDEVGSYRFFPGQSPTLEAQVSNFGDTCGYRAHDLEDSLQSGIVSVADYETSGLAFWERVKERVDLSLRPSLLTVQVARTAVDLMIRDVVHATDENLQAHDIRTLEDVRSHHSELATFSPAMKEEQKALAGFLMQRFYQSEPVKHAMAVGEALIGRIFREYLAHPDLLPYYVQERLSPKDGRPPQSLPMAIALYIAGMSDRYALAEHERLFGETVDLRLPAAT